MIQRKLFFISVALATLLSGCVGTGHPLSPNNSTQAGAATGAVAGAVIGANTGGRDKGKRMAIGAALGALGGGVIGNVIDGQQEPQDNGGWE